MGMAARTASAQDGQTYSAEFVAVVIDFINLLRSVNTPSRRCVNVDQETTFPH